MPQQRKGVWESAEGREEAERINWLNFITKAGAIVYRPLKTIIIFPGQADSSKLL